MNHTYSLVQKMRHLCATVLLKTKGKRRVSPISPEKILFLNTLRVVTSKNSRKYVLGRAERWVYRVTRFSSHLVIMFSRLALS